MRLNGGFAWPVRNCLLVLFIGILSIAAGSQSAALNGTDGPDAAVAASTGAEEIPSATIKMPGAVLPDAPEPAVELPAPSFGEFSSLRPGLPGADLSSDSLS